MKVQLQRSLPNSKEMRIVGATYPTPPLRAAIGRACSFAFMGTLALALAGPQMGFLPPTVVNFIGQQRGMMIGAGFMLNMVGNSLTQTGAYEVSLDGELIYSKLQTGAVPSVEEMRRIILEKTLLEDYGDKSTDTKPSNDIQTPA
ncbi:hypothetical protein ABB37_00286 [Leptomonas pyrrhocoris]|uniref:Selenoprotein T n=1 Tax=Leptomonas pyrrhocoris TaxID=157538 RepID=A0A0N0VHV7_LEPPY|nr:hypothetical protein ABB37_00286 [Leptomonas pyrrhocoris]KPA85998.1 hypothetical protein ABB37_00286 [Leptomonas pyrrhocoris]|eukprot:XP_015664437.1 hypothetical protein ABB37_00286 [Leptomonas pyrrhocoris]